jgi:hypothetical protein
MVRGKVNLGIDTYAALVCTKTNQFSLYVAE